MGLEMEGPELVHLYAQWLSLPYWGWGLIPNSWSRNPEVWVLFDSVALNVCFSLSLHWMIAPEDYSAEGSGSHVQREVGCVICAGAHNSPHRHAQVQVPFVRYSQLITADTS